MTVPLVLAAMGLALVGRREVRPRRSWLRRISGRRISGRLTTRATAAGLGIAVTLVVGGVLGVALGVGASLGVKHFLQWPIVVTTASVALSFGVAACVGIFFGYYPARKAAKLDPIDALRYE